MTVLEVDQPLAELPPPSPRRPLHHPPARGDTSGPAGHVRRPSVADRETAAEAAHRLVATHVPQGVRVGGEVPVELRYRGQGGHQRLTGQGRLFAGRPDDPPFAAVLVVADPLVVITASRAGQVASRWALVPGGPTVTARADALRLVRALRADGDLVLRAGSFPELPPLELAGAGTWSQRDEDEWHLFEDLATLEEWCGERIPVPRELSGEEVADIAQAGAWVRTERIEASLSGPLRFAVVDRRNLEAVDELHLHQQFSVAVARQEIPLGTGTVRIPVEGLRVEAPNAEGLTGVTARPRNQHIVFTLKAPPGRRLPARRTQPPTPRPGRSPTPQHALALPVVMAASQPVEAILHAVPDEPAVSERSSGALLDDLRSERA